MTHSKLPSLVTLRDLFATQFDAQPALLTPSSSGHDGITLSFRQLRATILRLSRRMFASGLRDGDVVSLSLANNIEFVTSFIATTWIGAASAPLNPNYTEQEVLFYLQDTSSKALIVPRNGGAVARHAAASVGVPVWEISYDKASGDIVLEPVTSVPISPSTVIPDDFTPDASSIALILHTSGTTSRPKAVPLSHRNLCASIHNIALHYRLDSSYRSMVVMPLFHVHGLMGALLSTFHSGGSVVIPPKFSASTFWPDFLATKCNWYSAVPTIHQILLQHEASASAKSLPPSRGRGAIRFIRSCSSALAPATFQQLEDTYGVPVIEAYAMTEASHQMTSNELPPGKRKSGSVGRATINVGVQIMGDDGTVMPQGKEGEVCVRGANVTRGYINNPSANATAFHPGGWFRTGDQGILDKDGFVFLTGRLKELINRGGEKISPLELDSIMLEHPAVAEAIAFGVPDKMYGQEVHAAIVTKTPVAGDAARALQADIKAFVTKKVAAFKVPKVIYFGETLPRTATGKIQRRHVATYFIERAAAAVATTGSSAATRSKL